MKMNYGSKIFSSVMANVDWNHSIADQINTKTGKYPAINCYDFIHIYVPSGNTWINYSDITPVTEWADKGGIVSLMWHFNVPKTETTTIGTDGSGVTCTTGETTFKASNALTSGTWENTYFYQQMDKVVDVLLKLQDAGISALWRPFHEGAGNATLKSGASWGKAWFWWGADGSDTYKALWKAMFTYFQTKGVHNLIWEWTTQNYNGDASTYNNDDDWYPGDDYVDMIGRDIYGNTAAQNKTEYSEITSRYPSKLVALAECGSNGSTAFANISDVWTSGAKWLYFMPWYGSNLPSDAWWTDAMSQSYVITRDKVNVNATTVDESAKEACVNMGLGYNLGNTLDANNIGTGKEVSAYETAWGQPVTTQALMTFLKKEGFNSVRVPVTWYEHLDADGNVDAKWMARVKEVADYVINAGMYCIINVHHDTGADNATSGFKSWIKADASVYVSTKNKYEKLWTQIANEFSGYDQHLLFEGYNEILDTNNSWSAPASGSASYTAINNYAQSFVNAVRNTGGNNATRNLIVNTYGAGNSDVALSNLTTPTDNVTGHIAVEIHTYDPYNWFKTYGQWTSACSTEIKNMFTRLNTHFVSKGIPVIVGEYGTHGETSVSKTSTTTQIQAAADQAADMVKQAKAYGIATFYWMSILEGSDRTVPQWTLPTVVAAMINANK
jgi:beta-mannanase